MTIHEDNAARVANALRGAGYHVEERHSPPNAWDEFDRHYVVVTTGGAKYEMQFHQTAAEGTSFMIVQSRGFDRSTAARLNVMARHPHTRSTTNEGTTP